MNIELKNCVVTTHNKLYKLPLGSIRAQGWLRDQLLRSKEGMGGHLDELEPDMIGNSYITRSRVQGLDPAYQAGWCAEIGAAYWLGLIELAFTLQDNALIQKAEQWVNGFLATQEADGYLGTYNTWDNREEDYNAWGCMWAYRALLSFYEATGRRDILDAVHRGLSWFCRSWAEHKTEYVGATILEAMVVVYCYTGDKNLLQFAEDYLDWLDQYSHWPNGPKHFASGKLQYNSMHTVAYGEEVKLPALVYLASGERERLETTVTGLHTIFEKIIQPTGGAGSNSEYLSPPAATTETEYCNFATFQQTYSWMSMITGDPVYGDEMERIAFNGAQGGRKKDEKAIAYFTAPNQASATIISSIYAVDSEPYSPCHHVACYPCQSVRVLPEFLRGSCLTDQQGGYYFLNYGPMEIGTDGFGALVDTLYPFRDTIRITLKACPVGETSLFFRIPSWCEGAKIRVNGQNSDAVCRPGQFAQITRLWQAGDEITLHFPMRVKIERVNDRDMSGKFPQVVSYGPLIFCLPVPEKWQPFAGPSLTPLPEGWTWYEVRADYTDAPINIYDSISRRYDAFPHNFAMEEGLDPSRITVEELPANGYVWENPPLRLKVPLHKAKYCFSPNAPRTFEVYEAPIEAEPAEQTLELWPYGCTALRITYFPRAKWTE